MSIQDIVVTVTGGTQNARAIVAGVTTQALEGVGFDAVVNTVVERDSNEVPTNERVRTILDLCKATGHSVFNTPITVEDGTVDVEASDDEPAEAELDEE